MSDLLPCPFCGSKAKIVKGKKRYCQMHGEPLQDWIVSCESCTHVSQEHGLKERAIQYWNDRYIPEQE